MKELRFTRRGEWKPMLLADVPQMIFSEVMRDLDLVVSVAHVGGVDPEATQSTVAMRSSLLEETCSLLKLGNVKLDSKHALIKGEYGQYSVHLGSGVVHKQPGGSLCVVAVNAQHRGRLFLPFADDDPCTAVCDANSLHQVLGAEAHQDGEHRLDFRRPAIKIAVLVPLSEGGNGHGLYLAVDSLSNRSLFICQSSHSECHQ